jgi:hypothetical protein
MTIQTKDEIYDFLLEHNSLKVKWKNNSKRF